MCMQPLTDVPNALRCGHVVCVECDKELLERDFLNCPVCRTPRDGVTEAEVQRANQLRDLRNRFDGSLSVATTPGTAMAATIFFPSEAAQFLPLTPVARTRSAAGRRALRPNPMRATALRVTGIASPRPRRVQRRGRANEAAGAEVAEGQAAPGGEDGEESEDDEGDEAGIRVGEVVLEPALQNLIAALTRPGTTGEFIDLRRMV